MKRIYSIDWLKFFAAFGVVVIHANAFEKVQLDGLQGEQLDQILETLSRFAVPFFFMVSGYFLGNKMNGPTIKKYVIKLIKLYLTWTLFHLLYDLLILAKDQGDYLAYFRDNWTLAKVVYYGNPTSAPHLWYLTATVWSVVILYLFYRKHKVHVLLLLSFLLNIVGILELFPSIPTRDAVFAGLFYLTSGYVVAQHKSKIVTTFPRVLFWLIPLFFLTQTLEGVFLFAGDYFFSTIPLTWLLILWALSFPEKGENHFFTKVGANSVSIYLVHWFLLSLVRLAIGAFQLEFLLESIWWGIGFPIVLFFVSYYSSRLGGMT